MRKIISRLAAKGWRYWLTAILIIVLGIKAEEWVTDKALLLDAKYVIYRAYRKVNPQPFYPSWTRLVLVSDEDYWKGDLGERAPIKRDYLACLLRQLAKGRPRVIALDFDLRSPAVDGSLREHPDYQDETDDLRNAVVEVAQRRVVVVLPTTVGFDAEGYAVRQPAVYDGFESSPWIRFGFIMPAPDIRQVPVTLRSREGSPLDSFAAAIVRAFDDRPLKDLAGTTAFPYGTFVGHESYIKVFSGHALQLKDEELEALFGGRIVLVGAAWHRAAYRYGGYADLHPTPAGPLPGVFIHANYVEALLHSRFSQPLGRASSRLIEFLLALCLAAGIAATHGRLHKIGAVAVIGLLILVLSYVAYQNFGRFFDILLPLVLVVLHALGEHLWELTRDAHAYRLDPQRKVVRP